MIQDHHHHRLDKVMNIIHLVTIPVPVDIKGLNIVTLLDPPVLLIDIKSLNIVTMLQDPPVPVIDIKGLNIVRLRD